ncbi:hypothetical protein [Herbiconiux daphne]|uniref:Uncharacterized protein n=1 Tax=Herbiconiux daphne TaxID=2970914 RepID=A0ABT2GYY0_9MICO|nr:hypothetical protein [Herbiconiux daphne]MCS5732265.1 hypothetical protein [Herbiconiux daphne]
MIKTELVALATAAGYETIDFRSMRNDDLRQLQDTITEIWVRLDETEDLSMRFEWLAPMIDAELRHRETTT